MNADNNNSNINILNNGGTLPGDNSININSGNRLVNINKQEFLTLLLVAIIIVSIGIIIGHIFPTYSKPSAKLTSTPTKSTITYSQLSNLIYLRNGFIMMQKSGGKPITLTSRNTNISQFVYDSATKNIYFIINPVSNDNHIYKCVIKNNSCQTTELLKDSELSINSFLLSPDSTRIIYLGSTLVGKLQYYNIKIYNIESKQPISFSSININQAQYKLSLYAWQNNTTFELSTETSDNNYSIITYNLNDLPIVVSKVLSPDTFIPGQISTNNTSYPVFSTSNYSYVYNYSLINSKTTQSASILQLPNTSNGLTPTGPVQSASLVLHTSSTKPYFFTALNKIIFLTCQTINCNIQYYDQNSGNLEDYSTIKDITTSKLQDGITETLYTLNNNFIIIALIPEQTVTSDLLSTSDTNYYLFDTHTKSIYPGFRQSVKLPQLIY